MNLLLKAFDMEKPRRDEPNMQDTTDGGQTGTWLELSNAQYTRPLSMLHSYIGLRLGQCQQHVAAP